jgi:hypothetical protein
VPQPQAGDIVRAEYLIEGTTNKEQVANITLTGAQATIDGSQTFSLTKPGRYVLSYIKLGAPAGSVTVSNMVELPGRWLIKRTSSSTIGWTASSVFSFTFVAPGATNQPTHVLWRFLDRDNNNAVLSQGVLAWNLSWYPFPGMSGLNWNSPNLFLSGESFTNPPTRTVNLKFELYTSNSSGSLGVQLFQDSTLRITP